MTLSPMGPKDPLRRDIERIGKALDPGARLGARIRAVREGRSISQEDLGSLANVHRTYIGAIERGETLPSLEVLFRIAGALKVPVWVLFFGE